MGFGDPVKRTVTVLFETWHNCTHASEGFSSHWGNPTFTPFPSPMKRAFDHGRPDERSLEIACEYVLDPRDVTKCAPKWRPLATVLPSNRTHLAVVMFANHMPLYS